VSNPVLYRFYKRHVLSRLFLLFAQPVEKIMESILGGINRMLQAQELSQNPLSFLRWLIITDFKRRKQLKNSIMN
jgi:hypothetical protein